MVNINLHNWHDLSLEQKINYVKGSYGGFNLGREDIERLPDNYREMRYEIKTIRMAVDVIDIQSNQLEKFDIEVLRLAKQLTATQQALDEAEADITAQEISYKEWVAKHAEMYAENRRLQLGLDSAVEELKLLKIAMGMHINADAYSSTFPDNTNDGKYLKKQETYLRLSARNLISEELSWECHEAYKKHSEPEILEKLKELKLL